MGGKINRVSNFGKQGNSVNLPSILREPPIFLSCAISESVQMISERSLL